MCRLCATSQNSQNPLASDPSGASICGLLRIWWNWQTRYFEVVVPQGVQVQVLLSAPKFLNELRGTSDTVLTHETAESLRATRRVDGPITSIGNEARTRSRMHERTAIDRLLMRWKWLSCRPRYGTASPAVFRCRGGKFKFHQGRHQAAFSATLAYAADP